MAMKVNWCAWAQMLREDAQWVRDQPRTLEREHVAMLLDDLSNEAHPGSRAFYDAQPEPEPHA